MGNGFKPFRQFDFTEADNFGLFFYSNNFKQWFILRLLCIHIVCCVSSSVSVYCLSLSFINRCYNHAYKSSASTILDYFLTLGCTQVCHSNKKRHCMKNPHQCTLGIMCRKYIILIAPGWKRFPPCRVRVGDGKLSR